MLLSRAPWCVPVLPYLLASCLCLCPLCPYTAPFCAHLGRRTADTQKLTQNILAANDQRLMAIALTRQQQAAARAAASQIGTAQGCSRAASAAQLLKAAELHGNVSAWEHLAEDDDRAAWGAGPADSSSSSGGGGSGGSLESGFYGDAAAAAAAAAPVRRSKRRKAGLRHGSRTELQDVPFGMLVLEVLLDATAGGLACVWGGGAECVCVCVCVLRGFACACAGLTAQLVYAPATLCAVPCSAVLRRSTHPHCFASF